MNTISLTIRIPVDIYNKLDNVSRTIGFTKVTFIRLSIFTYLSENKSKLNFLKPTTKERHRITLKLNESAYNLVLNASEQYNVSINDIVISLIIKYLDFFSKVLPELDL